MGYNARNDEIHDNIVRMQREWEAQRDALATIRRFNARLSAKGSAWFWPTIAAAVVSRHHWIVIACDSTSRSKTFRLPSERLRVRGVSHDTKGRALRDLEKAGLVQVVREVGKSPTVTLLFL